MSHRCVTLLSGTRRLNADRGDRGENSSLFLLLLLLFLFSSFPLVLPLNLSPTSSSSLEQRSSNEARNRLAGSDADSMLAELQAQLLAGQSAVP